MKTSSFMVLLVIALLWGGCSKKPKEPTNAERAQAANAASEAMFAMQVRDFPRAEDMFERAVELREDMAEYWVGLGMARRRQDDLSGARKAYKRALDVHIEDYKRDKKPESLAQQAWVLALLGRKEDALKLLERAVQTHPNDTGLRKMASPQGLPRTFEETKFKELAL